MIAAGDPEQLSPPDPQGELPQLFGRDPTNEGMIHRVLTFGLSGFDLWRISFNGRLRPMKVH
jgi:hypothetical protein